MRLPIATSGTTVIMPEHTVNTPAATAPARRRGRPPGARTRVLRQAGQALGVHHFAFLRAWLQGLPLKSAWDRYLAFAETSDDLRHIERCRAELLAQVLRDGHQINLTLPPERQITEALTALAQARGAGQASVLPTLDDFIDAQGLDPDAYSEAELLLEYRSFYGLDGAPDDDQPAADPGLRARVRALNQLEALLARAPQPADRIDLWFTASTVPRLKQAGVATLAALCDHIDVHGRRWWARLPGLGRVRAAAVLAWLAPLAQAWSRPLRHPTLAAGSTALPPLTTETATARRFALVPLHRLWVPEALDSRSAAVGSPAPVRARSSDDLGLLQDWLRLHAAQPATQRAYRTEVERFYLWCLHEQRKPLAGIDADDCAAYARFIGQPPAPWVEPQRVSRDDPAWRPFRGPLGPASQRRALAVVQSLLDHLHAAGHLAGNPMRPARRQAAQPAPARRAQRAFSAAEWQFMQAQLAAPDQPAAPGLSRGVPHGAEQRRLAWVLHLVAATGLRLGEVSALDSSAIRPARPAGLVAAAGSGNGYKAPDTPVALDDGDEVPAAWLHLPDRRQDGERRLPLSAPLLALLETHLADAAVLGALPSPAPLVCTLRAGVGRWQRDAQGRTQLQASALTPTRRLSAGALYRMLKRFFQRIATSAHAVDGLSAGRIRQASTQWLRHGVGLDGASAGWGLPLPAAALGQARASADTRREEIDAVARRAEGTDAAAGAAGGESGTGSQAGEGASSRSAATRRRPRP